MAPLIYSFTAILAFLSASIAEVISLRDTQARSQALAERNAPKYSFVSPSVDSSETSGELELLDIVLVASVDGKFHALNRTSGHTLWSMSSFPSSTSISAPSTLAPLIRTTHVDHDPEMTDETTPQEQYVIEPQSGDIYVMATPTSPLQRFPFSMAELVDLSPLTFAGTEDHRVFVGRKQTSLLLIELETGKIKATLNSECAWDQDDEIEEVELDLDELEGSKPPVSIPTEVYIGRTDYHVSIYTRPLNKNAPIQNLSFSTYGPNNKDNYLQSMYRRTKDDAYIQGLPNGEIISFKARSRDDPLVNGGSQLLWGQHFNTPIVAVFDVLRKPSHHNALVLLQPRPHLQDVLPSLTPETRLPNHKAAYVGLVQETGSLFAMSPERFPLVAFGGSERRKPQHPLIDATELELDNLPAEVDAITRARKFKERAEARKEDSCEGAAMYTDRRCLVGVRPLEEGDGEEGRLKRLLDGPTGLPWTSKDGAQPLEHVNNDSLGGPSLPLPGIGAGQGMEVNPIKAWKTTGNAWEAALFTIILGAVSFWFWLKRFKGGVLKRSIIVDDAQPAPVAVTETTLLPQNGVVKENIVDISNAVRVPVETPVDVPDATPVPVTAPSTPKPTPTEQAPANGSSGEPTADDSDREEGNEDVSATPGKRKSRRGKRGKKKKVGIVLPDVEDGEEEKMEAPVEAPAPSLVVSTPKAKPMAPSLIVSDTILGFGSHGTVVFQGSLQGRAVAVKRLLQDFVTLAAREVSILQESDDHPNVIRYYYQEAHANFLYIALELCPASLADIVENPDRDQWRDIAIAFDPKRALRQITSGLRHLHALKLVHRDIKPQNILVSAAKSGPGSASGKPSHRMLISDFGLCKKLDVDQTSFLPTAHGSMAAGTVGWRAPEILRGEVKLDDLSDDHSMSSRGSTGTVTGAPSAGRLTRLTKSVDIFALGCLFYYTLTNGAHPFGDRFEREVNIMKNEKNLEALQRFGEEGAEAADLIDAMLHPEAYERPDTTTILLHPFFWDPSRRLTFLQDASDRFEIMCRDPKDPYLLVLEKEAFSIVGNDWHSRLDKIFIENLGKFRKYDGRSVQDLLRALRNKKHHYQDLPDNVKRHLGPMPEGFLAYFTRRFPKLFLHVHGVVGATGLRTESMFRAYFDLVE